MIDRRENTHLYRSSAKHRLAALILAVAVCVFLTGCAQIEEFWTALTGAVSAEEPAQRSEASTASSSAGNAPSANGARQATAAVFSVAAVPEFDGSPYVVVNGNTPFFTDDEMAYVRNGSGAIESFEEYSDLDALGRCGAAFASVGQDLMPTEKRGSISEVHPSGWTQAFYDFVDGQALYNRCHLLGYQLTAENANPYNLITGTRYLNTQGMLPFENMVADYVKETGGHVLYRVTPVFSDDELVARGVLMEARSVEDDGEAIEYCVYAYNVQPGVEIDYSSGASRLTEAEEDADGIETFVLNTGTKRFHRPECTSAVQMSPSNREEYTGTRGILIAQGYTACGSCRP